jgi:hypothetical protein
VWTLLFVTRAAAPTPTCPICLTVGPLTDEDIVPTWMRRFLVSRYAVPGEQAPPRSKMRICRRCNETLGRRYENDARENLMPLLNGDPATLPPRQQSAAGRWMIKTTMLGCFAGALPDRWGYELCRTLLLSLRDTGGMPGYTSVRIAARDTRDDPPSGEADVTRFLPVNQMPRYAFFGINCIGGFVWEMVTGGTTDILEYTSWTDAHADEFVRIWPPNRTEVAWPPGPPLSMAAVHAMREVFVAAQKPGVPLSPPWRGSRAMHKERRGQ